MGLFVYLNGNKTSGDLTVSALEWTRNIQIEENIQYSESGWDVPDTAEVTSQRQELHHYDSVFSHYKDVEVQRSRRVLDHYETYYTYKDLGNGIASVYIWLISVNDLSYDTQLKLSFTRTEG